MAYYASTEERIRLIAGLRALARFLEDHADVPAPQYADVLIFPPDGADDEMRAEIDKIAAGIGSDAIEESPVHGHYVASRSFGPVEYRAVAIPHAARRNSNAERW
ncbi:MAG: hypothetical protein JOY82_16500 [Streptosporangiaceae bacterium]|nr:hypothetical protein [Streptosporangiaceae bacterium]MBV9856093.1 hypothetical protein [Streptosporangiaceae bacterium]